MTPRPDPGRPDFIEAVFTCRGDYYDPNFPRELQLLNRRLQTLLKADDEKLVIKKVEPWNSVKVTVNIPKETAERLKSLAQQNGGAALRNLGIMSIQMEGDRIISLTLKSPHSVSNVSAPNNQPLSRPHAPATASAASLVNNDKPPNLLKLPSDEQQATASHSKTSVVQPPANKVPPLVLSKVKPEKRQRKPAAAKSRSGKAKMNSVPGTGSTDLLTSSVPGQVSAPTNLAVMHPALKDTGLSSHSNLTDQETVNSLLHTLFQRSLDPKAVSKSGPLASQKATIQRVPAAQSLAKSLSSAQTSVRVISSRPGAVNKPSTTALVTVTTSKTGGPARTSYPCTTTAVQPRSEHVSVIAKSRGSTEIQTAAMDLSGSRPSARVEKPERQPVDLSVAGGKHITSQSKTVLSHSLELNEKPADLPYASERAAHTSSVMDLTSRRVSSADKPSPELPHAATTSVINSRTAQPATDKPEQKSTTPTQSSQRVLNEETDGLDLHRQSVDAVLHNSQTTANGLAAEEVRAQDLSAPENIVHGKPVSVICSTIEDKGKEAYSTKTSNEPSLLLEKKENCSDTSVLDTSPPLPPPTVTNGSELTDSKSGVCTSSDDINSSLCEKLERPTTLDQEPTENGSSTSTDSGVVAGSPKSDLCATPPAAEEGQIAKKETVHSSLSVPAVASAPVTIPSKPQQQSVIIATASTNSSNKNPAHVPLLQGVSLLTSSVGRIASATSVIKTTDPLLNTSTHQPLHLQQRQSPQRPLYLASNQDVSDVFLAASQAAVTIRPGVGRSETSLLVTNTSTAQSLPSARSSVDSKPGSVVKHVIVSKSNQKPVVGATLGSLTLQNSLLTSPTRVVPVIKSVVDTSVSKTNLSPSTNDSNTSVHAVPMSSHGTLLLKETVIPAASAGSSASGPKTTTVILTVNSVATGGNSCGVVSSGAGNNLPVRTSLLNAVVSTQPPTNAVVGTQSSTNAVVSTQPSTNAVVSTQPFTNTVVSTQPSTNAVVSTQPSTNAVVSTQPSTNAVVSTQLTTSVSNRISPNVVTLQNSVLPGGQGDHVYTTDVERHHTSPTLLATHPDNVLTGHTLVNGTSECGESESTDVAASSEALSPASFASGTVAIDVDVGHGEPVSHISALISPGQQRKSGRVRIPKSPDPDYITTTTKVRKRGSRKISESSGNMESAGPAKKATKVAANKIGHTEEPNAEPLAARHVNPPPQTNGPTSQNKRSTRSSGISDLQALPTVYRDRKRSKR